MGLVRDLDTTEGHLILHAKSTGAWIHVQGTMVTGTVLSAAEFRDFLYSCYNHPPPPLPQNSTANATAMAHPSIYATHLADTNEAWSG